MYQGKNVGVICSADAIIPPWAYMLVATYFQPVAKDVIMGDEKEVNKMIFLKNIQGKDVNEFTGQRIVIKGCGEMPIGEFAYMEITKRLRPVAKTIMYGEPCSTVPIYRKSPHPQGSREKFLKESRDCYLKCFKSLLGNGGFSKPTPFSKYTIIHTGITNINQQH